MVVNAAKARCLEARTYEPQGSLGYEVSLAITDQPVKPSRRSLRYVSVSLSRDGKQASAVDVSVGFHPLQSEPGSLVPGDLVLAPQHRCVAEDAKFEGWLALQEGEYQIDVVIDHRAHARFLLQN